MLPVSSDNSNANSGDGTEAERPAGTAACSDSAAEAEAAPAGSGVSPGQAPSTGSDGVDAADAVAVTLARREQVATAVRQLQTHLTWAAAQKLLDTGRLDRAAAALDALQEQAKAAEAASRWAKEYLLSTQYWLYVCRGDALEEAERVCHPATRWRPAQEALLGCLTWAVDVTRAQLDRVRGGWESRLHDCFGSDERRSEVPGGQAREVIGKYLEAIADMVGCYGSMQERFAGFLQGAAAELQWMAAAIYALIRLVRCHSVTGCQTRAESECHEQLCAMGHGLPPWNSPEAASVP